MQVHSYIYMTIDTYRDKINTAVHYYMDINNDMLILCLFQDTATGGFHNYHLVIHKKQWTDSSASVSFPTNLAMQSHFTKMHQDVPC